MTLNVAVIGVGYLGQYHAQKYAQLPECNLLAVVDSDYERAQAIAQTYETQALTDITPILDQLDAVSVVVPTRAHYDVVEPLLKAGIDVLIEKPITSTVAQADALIELAAKEKRILQVGHLERFNPVITAVTPLLESPKFIETVRISPFKGRGTDVNVILDLMIHDLDLVHALIQAPHTHLSAVGTDVFTDQHDIANARIQYQNGCVANVTASRISLKQERKLRIFQHNAYISCDLGAKSLNIYKKQSEGAVASPTDILIDQQNFADTDVLLEEIKAFIRAVQTRETPVVTGEHGRQALATALAITEAIQPTDVSQSA